MSNYQDVCLELKTAYERMTAMQQEITALTAANKKLKQEGVSVSVFAEILRPLVAGSVSADTQWPDDVMAIARNCHKVLAILPRASSVGELAEQLVARGEAAAKLTIEIDQLRSERDQALAKSEARRTDKEVFLELVGRMGLTDERDDPLRQPDNPSPKGFVAEHKQEGEVFAIGEGKDGYCNFQAKFLFDRTGKFLRHWVVE